MIIQLRIDDRLIHGEVVAMWLGYTNADVVCVADDATATNAMLKMAMSLAKPAGIDMPILTVDDAISYLNENADSKRRIFAVTQNVQNAVKIAQGVEALKDVNAGAMRASERPEHQNMYPGKQERQSVQRRWLRLSRANGR